MNELTKATEARMQKSVAAVQADFASVRAGRANPQVLDRLAVEYYGVPTPLNQVASISSPIPVSWSSSPGTALCSDPLRRPSIPLIWASIPRTTVRWFA